MNGAETAVPRPGANSSVALVFEVTARAGTPLFDCFSAIILPKHSAPHNITTRCTFTFILPLFGNMPAGGEFGTRNAQRSLASPASCRGSPSIPTDSLSFWRNCCVRSPCKLHGGSHRLQRRWRPFLPGIFKQFCEFTCLSPRAPAMCARIPAFSTHCTAHGRGSSVDQCLLICKGPDCVCHLMG